jgi:signal peptidase I
MVDMNESKDETTEAQATRGESRHSAIKEIIYTVVWAVVIAVVVRTFAYEPFNIPSGSMKPTLLIGDYLFVSKFSYGYSRYSFPYGLDLFEGRILADEPERGDVAVFRKPPQNDQDYIKRVIGLPGDRIQVKDGLLHINGEPVKREKLGVDTDSDDAGFPRQLTRYRETLPNGRSHIIWEETDTGFADSTRVHVVPEGHYFMMGDNRDHSRDSRAIGPVPLDNLIGRAEIIFLSLDGADLYEFWTWPWTMRFGRLGHVIE